MDSQVTIRHESSYPEASAKPEAAEVINLSGRSFVGVCALVAAGILFGGHEMPVWLLAAEVLATILSLFLLGSFKYQIHKNALTYGMLLVVIATFCKLGTSEWHVEIQQHGWWPWAQANLLTFHGLDDLIHADTMLFILGLTFFVSVVAQTRLLEGLTFSLLRRNQGAILPTIISVTAFVAVASAVIGGVSMIGLTIRTLVIVLLLAAVPASAINYAVIVCTAITTICGVWVAYGEPPNLIMKANLNPLLGNAFFVIYCAPAAIVSYLLIARQLRKRFRNKYVFLDLLDVVEANAQDVRFLQATRHGEVLTPVEFVEDHAAELKGQAEGVLTWLHQGESLGLALFRENVPEETRKNLLGRFVSEELADSLDRHYQLSFARDLEGAKQAERSIEETLASLAHVRRRAQIIGAAALVPFLGLLIVHGLDDRLPLFWASIAAFLCALVGIARIPKMRNLALREAYTEYAEYYFLFPLFLSITLLTKAGFFNQIETLLHWGIQRMGQGHVALAQFLSCTFLSAILDNNIVADFASRGLHGLSPAVLHLFAMAQIAGYALGGCWTHIGCAQSVVAFAFIRRDIDESYTPLQWMKEITPVILEILVALAALIYLENALLQWIRRTELGEMAQVDNSDGTTIGLGEQLDHYRIEDVVAQGRAAMTFRATDLLTNRTVAIVIPRPEIEADPVLSERFQREEEIEKTLDHPGLIRLIEKHGHQPGGGPSYMVREWFEGISLREIMSKGKLAPERAIRITTSICDIAAYVHGLGVVLHDLEPEHILVGLEDQVKLIHVGVTSKFGARRLTFTKLSQVLGISQYISPEELIGKHSDARSDIYSIGLMLYEMLTGRLPFQGSKIDDRLSSNPIPPRELEPSISPQLQEVIYRALERDPRSRYGSAHEFARDLTHLDQVGVTDRPELHDWGKRDVQPWEKIAICAVLALIPIAIFGLMLYFARR